MNDSIPKWSSQMVPIFDALKQVCFENAKAHGFHDELVEDGTRIALMHSELSEALEAIRKDLVSDHIPEFSGVEEEMADVIIRIMDFSGLKKLRIGEAILAKMAYNETREYKHGGKKF